MPKALFTLVHFQFKTVLKWKRYLSTLAFSLHLRNNLCTHQTTENACQHDEDDEHDVIVYMVIKDTESECRQPRHLFTDLIGMNEKCRKLNPTCRKKSVTSLIKQHFSW